MDATWSRQELLTLEISSIVFKLHFPVWKKSQWKFSTVCFAVTWPDTMGWIRYSLPATTHPTTTVNGTDWKCIWQTDPFVPFICLIIVADCPATTDRCSANATLYQFNRTITPRIRHIQRDLCFNTLLMGRKRTQLSVIVIANCELHNKREQTAKKSDVIILCEGHPIKNVAAVWRPLVHCASCLHLLQHMCKSIWNNFLKRSIYCPQWLVNHHRQLCIKCQPSCLNRYILHPTN